MSAIVACSPKTLSRRFQAELGSSPGRVYRHLRLAHAHQLLENTRLSISDISLRTGYNSPAALSRAFKARFGRVPRLLRQ
ncbi:helix-turn-helix domain-containing protein [Candidatus Ponderosibacter sp. Uisw_141_02]|uniref:helix-turn-helix domain-containing protein n=1 Tax=Candidatus Ponderosibacter sp. Uisw_141_02 TaxID=3231000 RepID=UPI003D446778